VKLELRPEIATSYKNLSQRARVLTETWASENLYCPACPCDALSPTPKGKKVIDFICEECGEPYQLKSHRHPFGNRVVNSAYQPKVDAISNGNDSKLRISSLQSCDMESAKSLRRTKTLYIVINHRTAKAT